MSTDDFNDRPPQRPADDTTPPPAWAKPAPLPGETTMAVTEIWYPPEDKPLHTGMVVIGEYDGDEIEIQWIAVRQGPARWIEVETGNGINPPDRWRFI